MTSMLPFSYSPFISTNQVYRRKAILSSAALVLSSHCRFSSSGTWSKYLPLPKTETIQIFLTGTRSSPFGVQFVPPQD